MNNITLELLPDSYTIHRFSPDAAIPEIVYGSNFFTISKTPAELSIVCASSLNLSSVKSEKDWSCFKVIGSLDFSLTGILSGISSCLANAEISIFAISTYDTDYILVKTTDQALALETLKANGYMAKS